MIEDLISQIKAKQAAKVHSLELIPLVEKVIEFLKNQNIYNQEDLIHKKGLSIRRQSMAGVRRYLTIYSLEKRQELERMNIPQVAILEHFFRSQGFIDATTSIGLPQLYSALKSDKKKQAKQENTILPNEEQANTREFAEDLKLRSGCTKFLQYFLNHETVKTVHTYTPHRKLRHRELGKPLTSWGMIAEAIDSGWFGKPTDILIKSKGKATKAKLYWAYPWLDQSSKLAQMQIAAVRKRHKELGYWSEFLKAKVDKESLDVANPLNLDEAYAQFVTAFKKELIDKRIQDRRDGLISELPEGEQEVVMFGQHLYPQIGSFAYSYAEIEAAVWLFLEEKSRFNRENHKVISSHLRHFAKNLADIVFTKLKIDSRGFLTALNAVIAAYAKNPSMKLTECTFKPLITMSNQT